MKPGIYDNLPFEDYLSIPAFSKSMVDSTLRSGEWLAHYLSQGIKSTPEMRLGNLIEAIVLEPDLFEKSFKPVPEKYTNSKGKEADFTLKSSTCRDMIKEMEADGVQVYMPDEYRRAAFIAKKILEREEEKVKAGTAQRTIVWTDPKHLILCKGRIDLDEEECITDLKTTKDARPDKFSRIISNLGYHVQAAAYQFGYEVLTGDKKPFDFIVAETEGACGVIRYTLNTESLLTGRQIWDRAVLTYKNILKQKEILGHWPGYSEYTEPIDVPYWAIRQELGDEAETLANEF